MGFDEGARGDICGQNVALQRAVTVLRLGMSDMCQKMVELFAQSGGCFCPKSSIIFPENIHHFGQKHPSFSEEPPSSMILGEKDLSRDLLEGTIYAVS